MATVAGPDAIQAQEGASRGPLAALVRFILSTKLYWGLALLLLDEPTRGIDVGAKAEIYRLIRELSAQGIAIVVASSEMPELLALSDRVLVLREGRPTAVLGHAEFVADTILDFASPGGQVQPPYAALWAGRPGGPAEVGTLRKAS